MIYFSFIKPISEVLDAIGMDDCNEFKTPKKVEVPLGTD